MRKTIYTRLAVALLIAGSSSAQAQVIAQWTFETSQPSSAANILPETGSGTLSVFHATPGNYDSPLGNGSSHSFLSTSWSVNDYYLVDNLNTTGLSSVVLSFDINGSNTGPKSFGIAYRTTNSGPYTVITDAIITVNKVSWIESTAVGGSSYSYTLPNALANQPDCEIKIYLLNNVAINGGTVASTGTNRIDNLTISSSAPLPLHFKSFTAYKKGNQNELKWIIANEKDVENYIVESSANGKDFFEAARVKPDNAGTDHAYALVDVATANKLFYRITGVNINGNKVYSKIVALKDEMVGTKGLKCNFDNGNKSLQFLSDGNYPAMKYCVINAAGAIVLPQRSVSLQSGINEVEAGQLSAGLYFVKCEYGGEIYSFKVVK